MLALIAGIAVLSWVLLEKQATTEFTGDSGVRGTVTIGPTCPVERIPPDPNCADRAYQTNFIITSGGTPVAEVSSNAQGKFEKALPPGSYSITPARQNTLPRGSSQDFVVLPGQFTNIEIQFDSGIR